MHRLSLPLTGLAAAALTLGLLPAVAQPATASEVGVRSGLESLESERPGVARGLIVKARTTAAARRAAIARSADARLPRRVSVTSTQAGPAELSLIRLDQDLAVGDLAEAIEAVEARPDVEWAVPDRLRFRRAAPPVTTNDPLSAGQGNLWDTRDVIDGLPTVGGFTTKAPALWPATRGSSSVVVAVVDTGITSHPDLAGQTVAGHDFVTDPVNSGDGDGWDPNPADPGDWIDASRAAACGYASQDAFSSWHGTHVAGTVAARADNGIGVAGVAPGVKVQPVRVMGVCGGYDFDIVAGILWAAGEDLRGYGAPLNRTPAKVINLSLGGDVESAAQAQQDCELYSEVASIVNARGATLVAAAGNSSRADLFPLAQSVPASCAGFISVTATSDTGHRAWYSTIGPGADISAPGGDSRADAPYPESLNRGIVSTINLGTKGPAGTGYGQMQGTSMAAPAVSAAAALLYSLGVTDPATIEAKLKLAVQPYSPVPYDPLRVQVPGGTATLATVDCNSTAEAWCGAGILDLSRVTAPRGGPAISGRRALGATVTARGRTVGPAASSTITWWRGATRVSTGPTYRIAAADLGGRLTARHTISSGPFAGLRTSASVAVPKTGSRTKVALRKRVKRSQRATMRVRVTAAVRPTGVIRVFDGKKRIAVKKLKANHRGTIRVRLPRLSKGKHRIRVVYTGNTKITGSVGNKVIRSR